MPRLEPTGSPTFLPSKQPTTPFPTESPTPGEHGVTDSHFFAVSLLSPVIAVLKYPNANCVNDDSDDDDYTISNQETADLCAIQCRFLKPETKFITYGPANKKCICEFKTQTCTKRRTHSKLELNVYSIQTKNPTTSPTQNTTNHPTSG